MTTKSTSLLLSSFVRNASLAVLVGGCFSVASAMAGTSSDGGFWGDGVEASSSEPDGGFWGDGVEASSSEPDGGFWGDGVEASSSEPDGGFWGDGVDLDEATPVPDGYHEEGFDTAGLDPEGFDTAGLEGDGYHEEGFDTAGLDPEGFDTAGLEGDGYHEEGFDTAGADPDAIPVPEPQPELCLERFMEVGFGSAAWVVGTHGGTPIRAVDSVVAPEGTSWNNLNYAVTLANTGSTPAYLMMQLPYFTWLNRFQVQADNNDSYRIQASEDGSSWTTVYDVPNVSAMGHGLRTRPVYTLPLEVPARFLRFFRVAGDNAYSVSEIKVWGNVCLETAVQ